MYLIENSKSIKSDLKIISDIIKWWDYKHEVDESDKSVIFTFSTSREANNIYKDVKSRRDFKDTWRLDIQDNELSYDFR